jgi:hypothetical protein
LKFEAVDFYSLVHNLRVMLITKQGEVKLAWTLDAALEDASIQIVERNDEWGLYRFTVGTLQTVISIKLCRSPKNDRTRFERSHDIHTPSQIAPYHSSMLFWDDPPYALHNAISGITEYYRQAVSAGDAPSETWLVENTFTEI